MARKAGIRGSSPASGPRRKRTSPPKAAPRARRSDFGHRRAAILDAATDLVLDVGYEAMSLDAVIARVGCSKATLYSYFGNKQGLLEAIVDDVVERISAGLPGGKRPAGSLRQALTAYAEGVLSYVLDERHIRLIRLIVAEVWRFPELARSYFHVGPEAAVARLAKFLAVDASARKLRIADPAAAATEFYGIPLWDRWLGRLCGVYGPVAHKDVKMIARNCVDSFLARYA